MSSILLAFALFFAAFFSIAEDKPRTESRILLQASPVAGYRYHEGKAVWGELQVGDALQLVREPDNPYDSLAVRVDWHGHVLGYVPRKDNRGVARALDRGEPVEAKIVKLRRSSNPRERILFEIYLKP